MGKKTKVQLPVVNPIEGVKNFGAEVGKSLANDLGKEGAKDFFTQMLGVDLNSTGERPSEDGPAEEQPEPGGGEVEIFNAKSAKKAEKPKKREMQAEGDTDYHREIVKTEKVSNQEVREMHSNIQEITQEIKKLISSSQNLESQFRDVAVEQPMPEVGKYHLNFFEWMLINIRMAREKVDDSGAWLSAVKGKSGKKGYWGMFKQHGTSFGLSNERQVATQVG